MSWRLCNGLLPEVRIVTCYGLGAVEAAIVVARLAARNVDGVALVGCQLSDCAPRRLVTVLAARVSEVGVGAPCGTTADAHCVRVVALCTGPNSRTVGRCSIAVLTTCHNVFNLAAN